MWHDGIWIINKQVTWGASAHYSLGRAKRWELFDRLCDAIEARKHNERETISRELDGILVPFIANEPYLPYRVKVRIGKPLPDDMSLLLLLRRWEVMSSLDSHGA